MSGELSGWTLADFRRHIPRIIAERDRAEADRDRLAGEVERLQATLDSTETYHETLRWVNWHAQRADRAERERDEARAQIAAVHDAIRHARDSHEAHDIAPFVFVDELAAALAVPAPTPEAT